MSFELFTGRNHSGRVHGAFVTVLRQGALALTVDAFEMLGEPQSVEQHLVAAKAFFGGPLQPTGPSRIAPVEAVVHAVCVDCRAGATLRVLLANRCETPVEMPRVPA